MSDLIPEGYYDAVAVQTADESGAVAFARFALSENGTRQVVAHFRILNPPIGSASRFPLPWYGYFTENTGKRTVESLRDRKSVV
jgi:hypothetical protein